jgi:hypothetical protein
VVESINGRIQKICMERIVGKHMIDERYQLIVQFEIALDLQDNN